MRTIFFLTLFTALLSRHSFGQTAYINPAGSYKLDSKTTIKDGETYGYFGEIMVKVISTTQIYVEFDVCKGAPSYNMGGFNDTLSYKNNTAVFKTDIDASCRITLTFSQTGITVKEETDDINRGCGFGHAVVANGFFKKVK